MGGGEAINPGARGLGETVTNASPLIALSQIGRLDLLPALFGSVIVPPAVIDETPRLVTPGWIVVRPLIDAAPKPVTAAGLGPGETEAIALALQIRAIRLILDERRATRLARSLGLPVIGTLGILLLGKAVGHLPAVRPAIADLLDHNFHLAPWLIDAALASADEAE